MEVIVTGRHVTVSDRMRRHIEEKVDKVPQLAPHTQRVEVVVSHEANRRQAKACERVEITCHARGPVIRAEACQDDTYAALDVAMDKLLERLRRVSDRKKVRRGRRPSAPPDGGSDSAVAVVDDVPSPSEVASDPFADSPIEVREKSHQSSPMTLEQALQEMELVGHDFFLYHDSETNRPSVVYRRRGWSYGVIHLDVVADALGPDS